MRVKAAYFFKIVLKSEMEGRLVRKLSKGQGATLHGFLDDTHRNRSQPIDV